MGTLYLVRHGQASFGADDYDVLSDLGYRQALRLGEYFKYKGIRFDAAFTGTLQRQVKTFEGICAGAGLPLQATQFAGLNEYDSQAVIAAIHPHKLEKASTPELYRHHFRLLKDGLKQWMAALVSPRGMPEYTDFVSDPKNSFLPTFPAASSRPAMVIAASATDSLALPCRGVRTRRRRH